MCDVVLQLTNFIQLRCYGRVVPTAWFKGGLQSSRLTPMEDSRSRQLDQTHTAPDPGLQPTRPHQEPRATGTISHSQGTTDTPAQPTSTNKTKWPKHATHHTKECRGLSPPPATRRSSGHGTPPGRFTRKPASGRDTHTGINTAPRRPMRHLSVAHAPTPDPKRANRHQRNQRNRPRTSPNKTDRRCSQQARRPLGEEATKAPQKIASSRCPTGKQV